VITPCAWDRLWNAGCTNTLQLHAEIKAAGYSGSYATARDYLRPFRATGTAPPVKPAPPKARHVANWILRDPATLSEDEQVRLNDVRARCPHLDALAGHVTGFARFSPSASVTVSAPGSLRSRPPMTSLTCTPSPPGSSKTTPPCSTA
jgi:hypothetical protein